MRGNQGAAAALGAAADMSDGIKAVVSREGRPDLTAKDLGRVRVPTLLIAGGLDEVVIDLNKREPCTALSGESTSLWTSWSSQSLSPRM